MVVVKQSRLKGRRPSPVLWEMVQKLSDEQWRQLKALSQASGKHSLQFNLLEFLRALPGYDADIEKEEFGAKSDLVSLRKAAKRWLITAARKLGLYANDLENFYLDIAVLIRWEAYDFALEYLHDAKQLATAHEAFDWLTKLHVDEWNYFILDRYHESIAVASQILAHYNIHPSICAIQQKDHAKILFRLINNFGVVGDLTQRSAFLHTFKSLDPMASANRDAYLSFYIHSLFQIGFDSEDMSLADEGALIWEANRDYLLQQPAESASIISMLFVCSYWIAKGEVSKGSSVFNLLYRQADAIKNVWAQAIYRILHIIILLEEQDERGLESYGINYKRHLKRMQGAELGLAIVSILSRSRLLEGATQLKLVLQEVLDLLQRHQASSETSYKPFLFPLILWAKRKEAGLK
jgi:hypothetical protein